MRRRQNSGRMSSSRGEVFPVRWSALRASFDSIGSRMGGPESRSGCRTALQPGYSATESRCCSARIRRVSSTMTWRDSKSNVLGTFAMYHRQPAKPRPEELRLVRAAAQLAGNAIERLRAERTLCETAERLNLAEKAASFGIWEVDPPSGTMTFSDGLAALLGLGGATRRIGLTEL